MTAGFAPSNWDAVELGAIATLHRGYDLPATRRRGGSVPVVSSSGFTGFHDESKIDPPGVVTGRYGTLGEVFFVEEPFWPLNTSLYVSDFHGNDARFVCYLLQCQGFSERNGAAAVPGINRNVLHRLPVMRPPLDTQRKIAAVLSAYDRLIENNDRRIALLEDLAALIYREWFVEYRYPGHELAELVSSASGPIPGGWSVGRVGDHVEVMRGRSYRSVDLAREGGVPFINLKCIARDGGFRFDGIKRFVGQFKDANVVTKGDVVMAVTDMTPERRVVARAARVPDLGEPVGVFSMDLVKLLPREFPREFILAALRYSRFPDEVKGYANGANVLHLHVDRIADYLLVFPPTSLASAYADIIAPLQRLADELHSASECLREARDLLLPRLISGESDLSVVEVTVPRGAQ